MADQIDAVEVYEVLRGKIGEEGAKSLIRYVDEKVERRAATKDDLEKLDLSLKNYMDAVRFELEKKIVASDWKGRLYFVILVILIIVTNPKVLEFVKSLLGIVK